MVLSSGIICASTDQVPTADFLSAALRYQEQAAPYVDVVYTYGSPTSASPAQMHYVRSPGVLALDEKGKYADAKFSFDRDTSEFRLLRRNRDPLTGLIGNKPQGTLASAAIAETVLYNLYDGYLYQVVATGKVDPLMEDRCWKVTIASPAAPGRVYAVWLDPATGYCPKRLQRTSDNSAATTVVTWEGYRQVSTDVWYPTAIRAIVTDPQGMKPYGKTRYEQVMTIQSVSIDKRPTKSDLLVIFPTGTLVTSGKATFTVE